jgi:hypothetical protein
LDHLDHLDHTWAYYWFPKVTNLSVIFTLVPLAHTKTYYPACSSANYGQNIELASHNCFNCL